jgi:hypothetical protein
VACLFGVVFDVEHDVKDAGRLAVVVVVLGVVPLTLLEHVPRGDQLLQLGHELPMIQLLRRSREESAFRPESDILERAFLENGQAVEGQFFQNGNGVPLGNEVIPQTREATAVGHASELFRPNRFVELFLLLTNFFERLANRREGLGIGTGCGRTEREGDHERAAA